MCLINLYSKPILGRKNVFTPSLKFVSNNKLNINLTILKIWNELVSTLRKICIKHVVIYFCITNSVYCICAILFYFRELLFCQIDLLMYITVRFAFVCILALFFVIIITLHPKSL